MDEDQIVDGGMGEGEGEAVSQPEVTPYLRDLTEDDVYDRLSRVNDIPNHLRSLESRVFGSMGPLSERLNGLEKSLGTRASLNVEPLKRLAEYDPKLAELLQQVLPEAINVNALDESALRPFLEPFQRNLTAQMGQDLVSAFYTKEEIDDFIPSVQNGSFAPTNQRQKDFVDWYAQQPFGTQQALMTLGAPYVKALQAFEKWEQGKIQEREKAAKAKGTRLANGAQPTAGGRRAPPNAPQTEDEAFDAGFNEIFNQRRKG